MKAAAVLVLSTLLAAQAQAQGLPYCVSVSGIPDECIYADGTECQTQAARLGGVCTANRAAPVYNQTGSGRFCLVSGGQASLCLYPDRTSCQADAVRRHAACVEAASPNQVDIDPFAIRRPY